MSGCWYDIEEILPGVVRVNDGDIDTSYIVRCCQRTAVIDTGMGIGDLAAVVAEVAPAKPLVINTHAHPDHYGGNYQFSDTSMSAVEWDMVQVWVANRQASPAEESVSTLDVEISHRPFPSAFDAAAFRNRSYVEPTQLWYGGDVIELGCVRLDVVLTPPYMPGGIALLDRERRLLFTGDTVLKGTIWLHLEDSMPPQVCFRTYERLAALADDVDHVLPAHGTAVLPGAFLTELNAGAERIRRGENDPSAMETFAGNGWYYDLGGYGMLFRDKIEAQGAEA